jgi:REP element-mobilizing transposase RayT
MDYQRFLDEMSQLKELGLEFISYCLMPNHFHLLVRVAEIPLSEMMQIALSRYAQFFNMRRSTSGHLFQGRYRADLVDSNAYLLNSIRYYHLNPLSAGLVANIADWRWSSHRALLGAPDQLIDGRKTLAYFGDDDESARRRYLELLVAAPAPDFQAPWVKPKPSQDLALIAHDAAQSFMVTVQDLQAPSWKQEVTRSKRLFARRALDCGYTRGAIAAFLGCHPTAISKIMSRANLSP